MIKVNNIFTSIFVFLILGSFFLIYLLMFNVFNAHIFLNISFIIIFIQLIHLILKHGKIIDIHFYFLIFSFIYLLIVPYLVFNYPINIYYGDLYRKLPISNMIYSNILIIIGLNLYNLISIPIRYNRIVMKSNTNLKQVGKTKIIIFLLIIFGLLSFFRLSISYGFDLSILFGYLENRSRGNFSDVYGKSYLKSLLFLFNIAFMLILYLYNGSRLGYILLTFILFYFLIILTLFDGQRLQIVGFIISAIIIFRIKYLINFRFNKKNNTFALKNFYLSSFKVKYLLLAILLILFVVIYGQYRSNNLGNGITIGGIFENINALLFYITNIFDSAITYPYVVNEISNGESYWYGKSIYMPILNRIPTFLFPEKLDYMYGAGKFTSIFLEYDHYNYESVARSCNLFCNIYLNFGAVGIISSFILFSLIGNVLNKKLLNNYTNFFTVIIFVSICAYVIPYAFKANIFQTISMFDIKIIGFLIIIMFANIINRTLIK
tara:strand:- start:22293 stop:23765 length:1473 start_codon:yes stop_codon:yes gene_type:complete